MFKQLSKPFQHKKVFTVQNVQNEKKVRKQKTGGEQLKGYGAIYRTIKGN